MRYATVIAVALVLGFLWFRRDTWERIEREGRVP